jgi:hypothetical protein
MRGKEYTTKLITKEDYNARVNFLLGVKEGNIDCREGWLTGNLSAYVGPQIGMNPIALWGLPDLEY